MREPRHLPSIDSLIKDPALAQALLTYGPLTVKDALRTLQSQWRERREAPDWADDPQAWGAEVDAILRHRGYRPVFNLTGTVIHTNLGRALPSAALFDAVRDLVTRPMNLEFDLATGARGDRDGPVEHRLTLLTGAEAATVVNNNAAALLLVLNTLARDRTVPVSRGELVEIGGSFRLPDIMERAGSRLLEIGTTNRTHPEDFAAAADEQAAMLLKVHPSNFHMSGFTRSVGIAELAAIAAPRGIPVCVDLGSGTLVDLTRWGLPHEPTPAEMLAQGADLVTFSGDKLLGGVQAGIILGSRKLIDACKRNPMKRALRPDKVTLAFLDALLARYEDPQSLTEHLPLLRTLTLPMDELRARGRAVAQVLQQRLPESDIQQVDSEAQIGSGSLPDQRLPSIALRLEGAGDLSPRNLHSRLRTLRVPVIGRLGRGALWLDMRGAEPLNELLNVLETLEASA